ncbi:hypothetical protein BKA70DRAFT_606311 [Coprinopsis sp. MPI-PUGE-AT-0042]|nr:hypothetical protein BKA70DRAFT_606311 [Coprinopsis sp. MPI-PUGE-AT-0042]
MRNWALALYFQPFATIRLDRMSTAFGWTVEEVEQQVVGLIQSGHIQGRVDSQNKPRRRTRRLSSSHVRSRQAPRFKLRIASCCCV